MGILAKSGLWSDPDLEDTGVASEMKRTLCLHSSVEPWASHTLLSGAGFKGLAFGVPCPVVRAQDLEHLLENS